VTIEGTNVTGYQGLSWNYYSDHILLNARTTSITQIKMPFYYCEQGGETTTESRQSELQIAYLRMCTVRLPTYIT
jgi:hypothetical protein